MTRYTHRNGETEPPTIEGWYAIQHPQAWNWQGSTFVFVERNMDGIDVYCTGQDDPIGYDQMDSRIRWYGPIVAPWEQPQPAIPPDVRETIEAMTEDWLQLYEPGSDEWANAQVIVSWLDQQEPTP